MTVKLSTGSALLLAKSPVPHIKLKRCPQGILPNIVRLIWELPYRYLGDIGAML